MTRAAIAGVETILLQIPYDIGGGRRAIAGQPAAGLNILLVRIETEDGLVGWGEAFGHAAAPATRTVIDTMIAPLLIGRDAVPIGALMADLAQQLHLFGRNGPVIYGLSGVDIALWDLAGKRANLPLCDLLGGAARRELSVYASLLRYGQRETLEANVRRAVAEGYRGIKLHEIDPALVGAARGAMGATPRLMVDTNCPWNVAEARNMARIMRDYDIAWLEEPVWPPEDHRGLAAIRREGIPLAAGENAAGLREFRAMMETGAVDIVQPSVTKVGGITETLKVVALAEAFGTRLVPHCAYFGPGYLASMHVAAMLREEALLERLFMDLEASPFSPYTEPARGRVVLPDAPGLGCDPDPDLVARYRLDAPRTE